MNPSRWHDDSTQPNAQLDQSSSDQFVYNPINERYIGKRTGKLFRRVKHSENIDGFPRFSEFESHGRDSSGFSSPLQLTDLHQQTPGKDRQKDTGREGNRNNKSRRSISRRSDVQAEEDSFVYEPALSAAKPKEAIIKNDSNSSSRIPGNNVVSFANISSIKKRVSQMRPSDVQSYVKLMEEPEHENSRDSFIYQQEVVEQVKFQKPDPALEQAEEQKKRRRTTNRVSFKAELEHPMVYSYVSSRQSRQLSAKKQPAPPQNDQNLVEVDHSEQFIRKLEESFNRIQQIKHQQQLQKVDSNSNIEKPKGKKEPKNSNSRSNSGAFGKAQASRKKEKRQKQEDKKQQQRKQRLMEAFKFSEGEKETKSKFEHRSYGKEQKKEVAKETKKSRKPRQSKSKSKRKSKNKAQDKKQDSFDNQADYEEFPNYSLNSSTNKASNSINGNTRQIKEAQLDQPQQDREQTNKNSRSQEKLSSQQNWNKPKRKPKPRSSSKQNPGKGNTGRKRNMSKQSNKIRENNNQPAKSKSKELKPRKSTKKSAKAKYQALLESQNSPKVQEKKAGKKRKVQTEDGDFETAELPVKSQSNSYGRYPKRSRVKPLKYWEFEKLGYKDGKIVSMTSAHSEFLTSIGIDNRYETFVTYNFQKDITSADIYLPPLKTIESRGFAFPNDSLEIRLNPKSKGLREVFFNDGINTITIVENSCVLVEPDSTFSIINESKHLAIVSVDLYKVKA